MSAPSAKRRLFTTPSSAKRQKTLTQEVSTLRRQVLSTKPELRQLQYQITVTPDSATGLLVDEPLLLPDQVSGDEIKLARITVGYNTKWFEGGVDPDLTGFPVSNWWILHSPKQGYQPGDGFVVKTNPGYYLCYPNKTTTRVWKRGHDPSIAQYGNNVGGTLSQSRAPQGGLVFLDKKFSIPMICGTDGENLSTVQKNQVYLTCNNLPTGASANAVPGINTLYVTIWFYDN